MSDTARIRREQALSRRKKRGAQRTPDGDSPAIPAKRRKSPVERKLAEKRETLRAEREKRIAEKRAAQLEAGQKKQRSPRRPRPTPPANKKKQALLIAAAIGGALLLGLGIYRVAFHTSTAQTDPAAGPYKALMADVDKLEAQVRPSEIVRRIDGFLKDHPEGKWADKARSRRVSTEDWLALIKDEGGLAFFKQEKALRQFARSHRLDYPQIFSRITRMKQQFSQRSPQEKLARWEKRMRARLAKDARRVAGETRKQAGALADRGELAAAIKTLDGYPSCFDRTSASKQLRDYRGQLTDRIAARTKLQARKSERLAQQQQQARTEQAARRAEQQRLAELRQQQRNRDRVANICSQIPQLIALHQYQQARTLLDGALASVKQATLRARLLREKQLVESTAAMMQKVRQAFESEGLRLKVLVKPGQAGTLIAMDTTGFIYTPGNNQLRFDQLKPDGWTRLLYKADAVVRDPIVAARFLYRIKGVAAADRLLARALQRQPELRGAIHKLLTEQGFRLPESFVYYQARWISAQTHAHLRKGELKVGDQWWTRARLTAYLSGDDARKAARADENSLVNLTRQQARYLRDMAVQQIRTIANHGPANRRLDITIVSCGFTAKEMANFRTTARQIKDSLGRLDPWGYYFNYLNVHTVEIADKEKADPFGSNLHKMKVPISGYAGKSGYSTWRANPATAWQYARLAPGADFVIVVANLSTGSASGDISGKMATIHRQGSNRYDDETNRRIGPYAGNLGEPGGDVATALAHVLGHAVARLADEYEYSGTATMAGFGSASDDDFSKNVCRESDVHKTPWHYWVRQPIHAPGAVKSREGAANSASGAYRAQANCVMRGTSNRYCVVCREQMERTLLKYIRPIEEAQPRPEGLQLWRDDSQRFSIRLFQPVNREGERHSKISVEWLLDGKPLRSRSETLDAISGVTLRGAELSVGKHELVARVKLISPYMRRDMGRSTDTAAWSFQVTHLRRPELIAPRTVQAMAREFVRFTVGSSRAKGFELLAEQLPEGASFDPQTRVFSWRPGPQQTGVFPIRFSARRGALSVSRQTQLIVRSRGDNYPPVCEYVPSIQAQAGTHLEIQLKATDLDGDQLRYQFVKAPNPRWAIQLDERTGQIRWFVPHHVQGNIELSWQVSDGRKTQKSKLLVLVSQGQLRPDSHFRGHEIGLGLWCESRQIRAAVLAQLGQQTLSFQTLQLTRLLRDVNGQIRNEATRRLRKLLARSEKSEAVLVCSLFLHAEGSNLQQHCVTPGAWSNVSSLLTLISSKQSLPPVLTKRAARMNIELEKIRQAHLGR